jgi:putative hemolysin
MDLLILLALIVSNALLALSEMAVVSSRKARLQQMADEGRAGAGVALALAGQPSRFLSTIQIGMTLVGVASGALGAATLSQPLAQQLARWPALAGMAEALALGVVVALITLAFLILGELVSKRLALSSPEAIASAAAPVLRWLATVTHPLVRALSGITDALLRMAGVPATAGAPVTQEEIEVLMEQGAEAGVFEKHEQTIVSRLFRLDQVKITAAMTPRADVVFLDLEEPLEVNLGRMARSGHSRLPVTRGGLDNVLGIAKAKTLLEDLIGGKPVDLAARTEKPLFVPTTLTPMQLVALLKRHRQTMALVVDEHGIAQGIVTRNDVMEALVGDIATVEQEEEEARDIVQREDGSWLVDGSLTIDRFRDVLGVEQSFPEEALGTYHTLSGFAMIQLARVPQVGDRFVWNGFDFEVLDMDRHRVDKLLVRRTAQAPAG